MLSKWRYYQPVVTQPEEPPVVIVGAGPAGLAVAAALAQRHVTATIVERSDLIGASWHARYDRLRLNTSSWLSHLPGLRFPFADGRFPPRDAVAEYLERYAEHFQLRIQRGVQVHRIQAAPAGGWELRTSQGTRRAAFVVIATGRDHTPVIPAWPGLERFTGEIIHAANYRNPTPFAGRRTLVVGPGNSGAEIALDLAEGGAAQVQLSVRTPPHIVHRAIAGIPNDVFGVLLEHLPTPLVDAVSTLFRKAIVGDLSAFGLNAPPQGLLTTHNQTGTVPTFDSGQFVTAIRHRVIEIVPAVKAFDEADALLVDGSSVTADAVIVATGYTTELSPLVGHLCILDGRQRPILGTSGEPDATPGLHFVGFTDPFGGNFRQIRLDATRIADHIAAKINTLPK